ncbi:MAG: 16S rRNA (guanine(966)-N(2))-methyltransferase RsmD [Hydrogenophilaceae bacterium]|nr:16S rRNA (guanine(966)-N(2))-methyltransferase RsmD [Hydrogenophilaceae bacterium]
MAQPANNQVRIVGGSHRGRKLHFQAVPGLRPTPDRVRETLFNWLGQRLHGLRCLDLFAGSGALGFEAVSRGAAEVVLVERDAKACAALEKNAALLGGQVVRADGLTYLKGNVGAFDVIFIDPPFAEGLWAKALALAATRLAPEGKIYLEHDGSLTSAMLTESGWQVLREGRAGQSHFCLLERA